MPTRSKRGANPIPGAGFESQAPQKIAFARALDFAGYISNLFDQTTVEGTLGKKVVFICSPSSAMLDMWLPILHSLREKLRGAEFVFLVPQGRQIGVLDLQNVLFTVADQIFDSVIFPSVTGQWKRAKSLAEAQNSHESESLVRIWRSVKQHNLAVRLRRLIAITLRLTTMRMNPKAKSPTSSALTELLSKESVVLFNIYEVDKPYMAQIAESLSRDIPKFSMYHGIKFEGDLAGKEVVKSSFDSTNTTALVFSSKEVAEYGEKFGIEAKNIKVVGIPRHEKGWIEFLTPQFKQETSIPSHPYILVISRPADDSPFFPRDGKLSSLRNIRESARENNLKVVIKLHPKEETDDGTAEEVFGKQNLGITWSFSNAHPLILGMNCVFAVSFFSGVAVDMARIGTPVIEHVDMKNWMPPNFPHRYFQDSEPVSILTELGLTLHASNRIQFNRHVSNILSDKEDIADRIRESYRKFFPEIDHISDSISRDIAAKLSPKQKN